MFSESALVKTLLEVHATFNQKEEMKPQMNPARLTPQPKVITAKNAKNAESEWLLFVLFAFFAAKIRAGKETFSGCWYR